MSRSPRPPRRDLAIVFSNRGLSYFDKNEFTKSLDDFEQSLKLNPTYAAAIGGRARVRAIQKNYALAESEHARAIQLDPASHFLYWLRGMTHLDQTRVRVYYTQNNYDQSIADDNTALALDPTDYTAFFNRGLAYFGRRDYTLAITDFTKANSMKADYIRPIFQRARVCTTP